ncbi:MAG: NUDIX hydrolase [Lautropia sp.]|nr:NUDIX hydrolase [Lautropia sp.]
MKYCSTCGSPTQRIVPEGDNRLRDVCTVCRAVHYVNPKIVAGAICTWEDRILLCRRAIEPRHGKWTLPAGFMEVGENVSAGALRETFEEAGADIQIERLFSIIDVPHAEQVHIFYRARLKTPVLEPGVESLEARLFAEDEIPWPELAFSTVETTLRWFLRDRRRGCFGVHEAALKPPYTTPPSDPYP